MDWLKSGSAVSEFIKKNKYVLLIVVLGMFLMAFPTGSKQDVPASSTLTLEPVVSVEEQLTIILGQIRGVGKVQVMITEQTGSETVYQTDEDRTDGEGSARIKKETVIVSSGGIQSGLVQTVTPPTYLGAIIVCQGAESPAVRLAVANAVSAVTGLGLDRISVLEMK